MNIGEKWKGWTVDSVIGVGSFGTVYKIVRNEFGHTYESALKAIRVPQSNAEIASIRSEGMSDASITTYYQSMIADIASEFALMSELRGNSNIVSYEDHEIRKLDDEFGWEIFIRMELLTPLFEYIKDHPMSEKDIVKMGIDICSALEVCSTFKIIHRDIKPENIFVSAQGNYKLGDFGIAKQIDKANVALSKKGTYVYMAPEVYREEQYNASVDTYSLGIVLYRFLNDNRTPFMPPAPQPIRFQDKDKSIVRRMSGEPISPPCNASPELARIILKACAYSPADRYANPTRMRRDLEALYPEEFTPVMAGSDDDDDDPTMAWDPTVSDDDELTVPADYLLNSGAADSHGSSTEASHGASIGTSREASHGASIGTSREASIGTSREASHGASIGTYLEASHGATLGAEGKPFDVLDGSGKAADTAGSKGMAAKGSTGGGSKKPVAIIAAVVVALAVGCGIFLFGQSDKVAVPDVVGLKEKAAQEAIESAELVYVEEREFSDEIKRGRVISQSISKGEKVSKETEVSVVVSRGKPIETPDVTRVKVSIAEGIAARSDLGVEVASEDYDDNIPLGNIISQEPKAGENSEKKQNIRVVVSKGIEQIEVPDVTGMTPDKARAVLADAGLEIRVKQEQSKDVPSGQIISQSIEPGKIVDHNSTVTVRVSVGSANVGNDD